MKAKNVVLQVADDLEVKDDKLTSVSRIKKLWIKVNMDIKEGKKAFEKIELGEGKHIR